MVFSDPPYNVPIQGHVGGSGAVKHQEFAMAAGEMTFLEHLEELRRRLIWSLVFVAAAFTGCWVFSSELYATVSIVTLTTRTFLGAVVGTI